MKSDDIASLIERIQAESVEGNAARSAFRSAQRFLRGEALCSGLLVAEGLGDATLLSRLNAICQVLEALKPPCIVQPPIDPDDLTEKLRASIEANERKKNGPTLRRV